MFLTIRESRSRPLSLLPIIVIAPCKENSKNIFFLGIYDEVLLKFHKTLEIKFSLLHLLRVTRAGAKVCSISLVLKPNLNRAQRSRWVSTRWPLGRVGREREKHSGFNGTGRREGMEQGQEKVRSGAASHAVFYSPSQARNLDMMLLTSCVSNFDGIDMSSPFVSTGVSCENECPLFWLDLQLS